MNGKKQDVPHSVKKRSNVGPALFGTSSALMMTLDVALGACVSKGEKWNKKNGFKRLPGIGRQTDIL